MSTTTEQTPQTGAPVVTLSASHPTDGLAPLATVALGTPSAGGHFDAGDLGFTGGNLYLFIDGVEYGSLYFSRQDGEIAVTLGQYQPEAGVWVETGRLPGPVDEG